MSLAGYISSSGSRVDDGNDAQIMTNDNYDDSEYEEVLIVATFQDVDESFTMKRSQEIAFSNVETSSPTCVIDGKFKFRGSYESALGLPAV